MSKSFLKKSSKLLWKISKFTLVLTADILASSAKEKEHEPTFEEITCGERIIGSDKYFIPEEKKHS